MVLLHPPDYRTALAAVATAFSGSGSRQTASRQPATRISFRPLASGAADSPPSRRSLQPSPLDAAASRTAAAREEKGKPEICTADELHYAPVPGTEWRLALWRYRPPPEAPTRNHPLMLLSGVGTNAIGFDLSPGASFARHMSCQGFDTWIVEVRGAGLSTRIHNMDSVENKPNGIMTSAQQLVENSTPISNSEMTGVNGKKIDSNNWNESELVTELTDSFMSLAERLSGYLNDSQLRDISANFLDRISELLEDTRLYDRFNEIAEKISGLLQARQSSAIAGQVRDLSQRLINVIEEGQRTVSPQLFDFHDRLAETIEDFQKQLNMIITYDWDFDHYLEEDVPAAMEYIRLQTDVKDGKLLAIGHSMGGILLYSMISKCAYSRVETGLAAVVTLASSVDYTSSNSSLKLLLPLANPAEALNVPAVPLGALLTAAHPLSSRPPYVLSWLNDQISAQDMMHPELFSKLVLNNFCTIPAKVLLQLTTAFREGGLRNRSGTFSYKNHLQKCDVPVLALAGDRDLICPPEAVYETVKLIPKEMVTYKVLGRHGGPHYAHYDLVGGRLAVDEVYPCIIEFLSRHDGLPPSDEEEGC